MTPPQTPISFLRFCDFSMFLVVSGYSMLGHFFLWWFGKKNLIFSFSKIQFAKNTSFQKSTFSYFLERQNSRIWRYLEKSGKNWNLDIDCPRHDLKYSAGLLVSFGEYGTLWYFLWKISADLAPRKQISSEKWVFIGLIFAHICEISVRQHHFQPSGCHFPLLESWKLINNHYKSS